MLEDVSPLNRIVVAAAVGLCFMVAAVTAQQPAPQATPMVPKHKVGDAAPEFSLPGTDGKTHKLSDYKGKTVVIAWFLAAFTGG